MVKGAKRKHVVHSVVLPYKSARTRTAFAKLSGFGDVEIDQGEAVALLKERVEKEDDDAAWMLGLCFEYGVGTRQDSEQALLLYRQSQQAGNIVADFLLDNGCGRGDRTMNVRGLLLWKPAC